MLEIRMPYRHSSKSLDHATQELVQAVTAAFALVSASDGEIATSECQRFNQWFGENSSKVEVQEDALADFETLCSQLATNYDLAHGVTKARIELVGDQDDGRTLVLAAARAAVIADGIIEDREEVVVRELCELLGLDPSLG